MTTFSLLSRRKLFQLLFAALAVAAVLPVAAAQGQSGTRTIVRASDAPSAPQQQWPAQQAYELRRTPALLDANLIAERTAVQDGDALSFSLFDGETLRGTVSRATTTPEGVRRVRGRLEGKPYATFVLSKSEERLTGRLRLPSEGRSYAVQYSRSRQEHVLIEEDLSQRPPEQCASALTPPPGAPSSANESAARVSPQRGGSEDAVDVMVLYTQRAEDWATGRGSSVDRVISQATGAANASLNYSNVDFQFKTVHAEQVPFTTNGSLGEDLRQLQQSGGQLSNADDLRDEYNADLVTLLVDPDADNTPQSAGSAGIGYVLGGPSGSPDYAFNVTEIDNAEVDYTHAHELGHNMGNQHNEASAGGQGAFNFSYGWRYTGNNDKKYATVMAYNYGGARGIGAYSNPLVKYEGQPTGTNLGGDKPPADNAQSMEGTKNAVISYRGPDVSETDGPDLLVETSSVEDDQVQGGQKIAVEATVHNNGDAAADSSGLSYFLSQDGAKSDDDVRLSEGSVGSLGLGHLSTNTDPVIIPSDVSSGEYQLLVAADAGDVVNETKEGNNVAATALTVIERGDPRESFALALTATPKPVQPGGQITFALTAANQDAGTFRDVRVQLALPASLESFSPGPRFHCDGDTCDPDETMTWTVGVLPGGDSRTGVFAARLKSSSEASSSSSSEEMLTASGALLAEGVESATASAKARVAAAPTFQMDVNAGRAPALPGVLLTYTLTYSNLSDEAQSGVTMRAPLPSGTQFVSAEGSGLLNDGAVQWTIGEVAAGAVGRRTLTVRVDEGLTDGAILTTSPGIRSSSGEEAQAESATPVHADAPLFLQANASPDPAAPGETTTFSLTLLSQSDGALENVQLKTTVPEFVDPFRSGDLFSCDGEMCEPGETMTWILIKSLSVGQSRTAEFEATWKDGSEAPPTGALLTVGGTVAARETGGGGAAVGLPVSPDSSYRIDETLDGRFVTSVNEDDGTYTATVQLRSQPGETDLDSTRVRIGYNDDALQYASGGVANYTGTQPSFTGGTATYDTAIQQPEAGVVSVLVDNASSTDGNGKALTSTWTDVATLTFDILNPGATSGLNWLRRDVFNRLATSGGRYRTGSFEAADDGLPVELAAFSGRADGRAAVLEWKTLSETNNAGFYVERQTESGSWTTVGEQIEGAGTSQEARRYSRRIEDLDFGTHTFRLRQVDADGTEQVLDVRARVEVQMSEAYVLEGPYPNPFRQRTTVEFAVQEPQTVTVALYDAQGRRVRVLKNGQTPGSETVTLRLQAEDLASGVYFLRLRGEDFAAAESVTLVR